MFKYVFFSSFISFSLFLHSSSNLVSSCFLLLPPFLISSCFILILLASSVFMYVHVAVSSCSFVCRSASAEWPLLLSSRSSSQRQRRFLVVEHPRPGPGADAGQVRNRLKNFRDSNRSDVKVTRYRMVLACTVPVFKKKFYEYWIVFPSCENIEL